MNIFRTRPLGNYIVQLSENTILPMDVGVNISRQVVLASKLETLNLLQDADFVRENIEIAFPLVLPGGADTVTNEDDWGIMTAGFDASRFWQRSILGEYVRIGLGDSGMDASLPTFSDLIAQNRLKSFSAFGADGVKVVQKDSAGNDVPDAAAKPTFSHWHGTFCAATLVGQSDDMQRGVAPGAELVVAQLLQTGNIGTVASILAGLNWLADQSCDIVSLSVGWPGMHDDWARPIAELLNRGTVVVAAVGNENGVPGTEDSRSPANYPFQPTDEKQGILISVGAHDISGAVGGFSGGEEVDWSAAMIPLPDGSSHKSAFASYPRVAVPMMVAPGVDIVQPISIGNYQSESGSSMATPHVAGLLALILSALRARAREATPRQAAEILLKCLRPLRSDATSPREGRGRPNIDILFQLLAL
jgi:subtilisin family serine protease